MMRFLESWFSTAERENGSNKYLRLNKEVNPSEWKWPVSEGHFNPKSASHLSPTNPITERWQKICNLAISRKFRDEPAVGFVECRHTQFDDDVFKSGWNSTGWTAGESSSEGCCKGWRARRWIPKDSGETWARRVLPRRNSDPWSRRFRHLLLDWFDGGHLRFTITSFTENPPRGN